MQLERGLRIIDSPGVVFDDDDFDDGKGRRKGNILLRNVVKVEDIEDPVETGGYCSAYTRSLSLTKKSQSRRLFGAPTPPHSRNSTTSKIFLPRLNS